MSLTSPSRGWLLEELEYDSGQLEGIHGALEDIADRGTDAALILSNIEAGLEGRGEAITRATSDAGKVARRIRPTVAEVRRIGRAVRAYGEAVAVHAKQANELIEDVRRAHSAAADARQAKYDAWRVLYAAESGTDADAIARADQAYTDAQGVSSATAGVLEDAWAQWEAAYARWDEAYGQAVSALARAANPAYDPAVLGAIDALANADTPERVAEIWAGLTPEEQARLRAEYPGLVGNLEGVPYLDRFLANRAAYEATVAAGPYGEPLDAQLSALGTELRRFEGQLLFFHPFEHPQATAAVMYGVRIEDEHGDPVDPMDGITNVNVLVGGMFSSLDDLQAWGESARNLNAFADAYGDGARTATIAWYGYDSPNLLTEHTMGSATEGAARLTQTLRGLDNEVSSTVTTSVIGHSYGSTTAFLAVGGASDDLGVDRLIAVGSAGVPDGYHANWTDSAPMDYSGTDVYASRAPWDFIARYGEASSFGHGMNPEDIPGAVTFESDGGTAPTLDGTGSEQVHGTPGHAAHDGGNSVWGWWETDNGYLSRDSESFRNIAHIVATGEPLS